ncbi:hypothetical protein KAR91_26575 [Candidatus Pacearchaeota archaeon]|nr:hypothetical protein [Candidatus Pacearchaeota archaeon]
MTETSLLHYYDYHTKAPFKYGELVTHYNDFFSAKNHFNECNYQNKGNEGRIGCDSQKTFHVFLKSRESIKKEKSEFKVCCGWSQFESITWCNEKHCNLCSFGKSLSISPSEIVLWDRCNKRCINNFSIDHAEQDQVIKILSTAIFNYRKRIEEKEEKNEISEEKWALAKFFWFSQLLWEAKGSNSELNNPVFWNHLPPEILEGFFSFFDSIIDYTSGWSKYDEWPEQMNDLLTDRQIHEGLQKLIEDDLYPYIRIKDVRGDKDIILKEFQRASARLKKIIPYKCSLATLFGRLTEKGINLTRDNRPGVMSSGTPWISNSFKNYAFTSNPDIGNKHWKYDILCWAVSTEITSNLKLSNTDRKGIEFIICITITKAIEEKPSHLHSFFKGNLLKHTLFNKFKESEVHSIIDKLVKIFDITKD